MNSGIENDCCLLNWAACTVMDLMMDGGEEEF